MWLNVPPATANHRIHDFVFAVGESNDFRGFIADFKPCGTIFDVPNSLSVCNRNRLHTKIKHKTEKATQNPYFC